MGEPQLLRASTMAEGDRGSVRWRRDHNAALLAVSDDGARVAWSRPSTDAHPAVWVPIESEARLFGGAYEVEFVVEEMAAGQIGVGFLLAWDIGPDWGFFGYLGSSPTAWAYDLSSGDVVCATRSIEGGLGKSADGHTGVVTLRLDLPSDAIGTATFAVGSQAARPIALSEGAVVIPAACLLRPTQAVRITARTVERARGA